MKRFYKQVVNGYTITVKDYQYKGRLPVSVRVSGLRLGECTNPLGEPCYFYKTEDAYTLEDGIKAALRIVNEQVSRTR